MRIAPVLFAVTLAASLVFPARAQDTDAAARAAFATRIAAINARLDAVPDSQGLKQACAGSLAAADRASNEGRFLVALAAVRRCLPFVSALEVVAARTDEIAGSLDAFRAAWREAGADLKTRRAALGATPGAHAPLAVRAMIESDLASFETYYTSALLYGENTTIESGLLYLGFPYGIVDFAEFAAALPLAAPAPAPALPDLGGALFALDGELLDVYKAQTTPEARSALAGTNSMFKVAQDLRAAKLQAGTLFEYLRTVESLAANRAAGPEPAAAGLRERAARYAYRNPAVDNTIAGFFVERARGLLGGDDPGPVERRYAAAILDTVLPAYERVIAGDVPALPVTASGEPVTVTLVRWPYT